MRRALLLAGALLALDAPAQAPAAAPQPEARQLQILQKVMPSYEAPAGFDGGCVTVEFVITHQGFVGDVVVLEARPEALAEPTVTALKQWWFQSFPPPDVTAVQTFHFAPELVKLPDDVIRSPYAVATSDGKLSGGAGCTGKPPVTAGKRKP